MTTHRRRHTPAGTPDHPAPAPAFAPAPAPVPGPAPAPGSEDA
ncbi:hypothetical protein ACFWR9_41390 [Streptomyces sp. NPDC058534]